MTTTKPARPNAQKSQAQDLRDRTGMRYAAALRQVMRANRSWQPAHRWVLTDDVHAWLAGDSWHGRGYDDLYAWLDHDVHPVFSCDRCGKPGDARTNDSSISLIVTAYDPDFAPVTEHLRTERYHASCQRSSVVWEPAAVIPTGPRLLTLPSRGPATTDDDCELEVRAVLDIDPRDRTEHAMLLLTAHITDAHSQGALAWLTGFEMYLASEGLGRGDDHTDGDDTTWTLRIATEHTPQDHLPWIAVRTGNGRITGGAPQHLLRCRLDLPDGWAEAARRDGYVDAIAGPCTRHWDFAPIPEDLDDEFRDLFSGNSVATDGSQCGCALLTPDNVVALADSGAFFAGSVRVLNDEDGD
ncbi:MAG TPA: hypothetical protein VFG15_03380 [Amycolatopsis sp.]|nr:hypothetical protein [Amycolatopsis sp.]